MHQSYSERWNSQQENVQIGKKIIFQGEYSQGGVSLTRDVSLIDVIDLSNHILVQDHFVTKFNWMHVVSVDFSAFLSTWLGARLQQFFLRRANFVAHHLPKILCLNNQIHKSTHQTASWAVFDLGKRQIVHFGNLQTKQQSKLNEQTQRIRLAPLQMRTLATALVNSPVCPFWRFLLPPSEHLNIKSIARCVLYPDCFVQIVVNGVQI